MNATTCEACGNPLTRLDMEQNRRWCRRNSCTNDRRNQVGKMLEDRELLKPLDKLVRARKAAGSAWWWR